MESKYATFRARIVDGKKIIGLRFWKDPKQGEMTEFSITLTEEKDEVVGASKPAPANANEAILGEWEPDKSGSQGWKFNSDGTAVASFYAPTAPGPKWSMRGTTLTITTYLPAEVGGKVDHIYTGTVSGDSIKITDIYSPGLKTHHTTWLYTLNRKSSR
jgi:hypothetical protein